MYPTDLKYTRDHEWVRTDGEEASVGITDFAQQQLGDIVYIDLPAVGKQVAQGEVFGTVESVKAVSELFSPVSGEIVAVNADLGTHPEKVNSAPHGTWMIRVKVNQPSEFDALLDSAAYSEIAK
jgi:glycine cleavage system H protein